MNKYFFTLLLFGATANLLAPTCTEQERLEKERCMKQWMAEWQRLDPIEDDNVIAWSDTVKRDAYGRWMVEGTIVVDDKSYARLIKLQPKAGVPLCMSFEHGCVYVYKFRDALLGSPRFLEWENVYTKNLMNEIKLLRKTAEDYIEFTALNKFSEVDEDDEDDVPEDALKAIKQISDDRSDAIFVDEPSKLTLPADAVLFKHERVFGSDRIAFVLTKDECLDSIVKYIETRFMKHVDTDPLWGCECYSIAIPANHTRGRSSTCYYPNAKRSRITLPSEDFPWIEIRFKNTFDGASPNETLTTYVQSETKFYASQPAPRCLDILRLNIGEDDLEKIIDSACGQFGDRKGALACLAFRALVLEDFYIRYSHDCDSRFKELWKKEEFDQILEKTEIDTDGFYTHWSGRPTHWTDSLVRFFPALGYSGISDFCKVDTSKSVRNITKHFRGLIIGANVWRKSADLPMVMIVGDACYKDAFGINALDASYRGSVSYTHFGIHVETTFDATGATITKTYENGKRYIALMQTLAHAVRRSNSNPYSVCALAKGTEYYNREAVFEAVAKCNPDLASALRLEVGQIILSKVEAPKVAVSE